MGAVFRCDFHGWWTVADVCQRCNTFRRGCKQLAKIKAKLLKRKKAKHDDKS